MSSRGGWGGLVVLGAAAAAALYILPKLSKVAAAATGAVSSGIANTYEALTFSSPIQVVGNVDDQQGNLLGPISMFPAATDSQGNTYLDINGMSYQLGPRDSNGNFTAIPTGQPAS